jgi:phosphatidylglycerol:prolipoprotein diacylglycerol transferase
MQQTLFFIPHEWFDGRLLIAWLVVSGLVFAWLLIRQGMSADTWSFLPVAGIVAAVIYFVLPQLEVYGVNPADPAGDFVKLGLAVRGYGVFLCLAIVLGVGLVLLRCRQVDIDPDRILTLAFWMTICGIAGARMLYVVQKSEEFFGRGASLPETIVGVMDMTKGGLVVYGSLIGGMLAAIVYFRVTRMSFAKLADLIVPGMLLGLAIGRIGCLMNGCCYGGICNINLPSLEFPAGSPPYLQQLVHGDLLGMSTEQNVDNDKFMRTVTQVDANGVASDLGIDVGDHVTIETPDSMRIEFFKKNRKKWTDPREFVLYIDSEKLGVLTVPLDQIQNRTLPVHPTQIYSAINAGLLSLLLWFYWPIRRFDGEVFALMLILYSIGRFLLEIIRGDESGLLGSSLTISQWVSVGTIVVGFALMAYVRFRGEPLPAGNPEMPTVE